MCGIRFGKKLGGLFARAFVQDWGFCESPEKKNRKLKDTFLQGLVFVSGQRGMGERESYQK